VLTIGEISELKAKQAYPLMCGGRTALSCVPAHAPRRARLYVRNPAHGELEMTLEEARPEPQAPATCDVSARSERAPPCQFVKRVTAGAKVTVPKNKIVLYAYDELAERAFVCRRLLRSAADAQRAEEAELNPKPTPFHSTDDSKVVTFRQLSKVGVRQRARSCCAWVKAYAVCRCN
jgi:hypothetical protein